MKFSCGRGDAFLTVGREEGFNETKQIYIPGERSFNKITIDGFDYTSVFHTGGYGYWLVPSENKPGCLRRGEKLDEQTREKIIPLLIEGAKKQGIYCCFG